MSANNNFEQDKSVSREQDKTEGRYYPNIHSGPLDSFRDDEQFHCVYASPEQFHCVYASPRRMSLSFFRRLFNFFRRK